MLKRVRNTLIVVIVCLTLYMLYGMYSIQAEDLLARVTDGRYGKRMETVHTEAEGDVQEESSAENEMSSRKEKVSDSFSGERLPTAYDCRFAGKAPTVKNQGTLGTCWAVAASSVLESRVLPEEDIVFSADHISTQNGYTSDQQEGGAYMISAAYLAAWKGPVTEEQDPYGDGVSAADADAIKHVQEIQIVSDRDFSTIKHLIYEYGAVQSSIYMDMGGNQVTSEYYDPEKASYYYDGAKELNHDIVIIGWDDNYPAENFTHMPSEDGAFICQNSWGETFGENGIFYVSYEDTGIGSNCAAYTRVESADNYDHIYQTDLCGWVGQMGYGKEECWFANVYTADSAQTLRAVGFYATGKDTDYEIRIVQNYQNILSLVLSEKVQEGHFDNIGFYTVDLEKDFEIAGGQQFAVMVKIKTPDTEYPVAMEYRADSSTENVILDDGEGYVSTDGYRWIRMEEEYNGNICLKAYSDDE